MNNRKYSTKELISIFGFSGVCIGIVIFMFVYIPDSVLYAKDGILRWLPFLLIFGGIPFSIYKVINVFHQQAAKALAFGSVLIIGPLFGYQSGKNEMIALERDGVVVNGYISEKWYSTVNKNNEWLVKVKFQADGEWYESFSQTDEDNIFQKNQEIEVIYSERNPDLNRIYPLYKKEK